MDATSTGDYFFKIAAIVSPVLAAAVAGLLAYRFAKKGKKLDILYANKVPALKAIATQLFALHGYISGALAYLQANEYAGNYHQPGGALQQRAELANVVTMNKLFLLHVNRLLLDNLLSSLSILCAAEARFILNPSEDLTSLYTGFYDHVNVCINALHQELYA